MYIKDFETAEYKFDVKINKFKIAEIFNKYIFFFILIIIYLIINLIIVY